MFGNFQSSFLTKKNLKRCLWSLQSADDRRRGKNHYDRSQWAQALRWLYWTHFIWRLSLVPVVSPLNRQNQLFRGVLYKGCSWKFCKIHKNLPVPESLFNKVADLMFEVNNIDTRTTPLRSIRQELFFKKAVLENFAISSENISARVSFILKLQASCSKLTIETPERHQWRRTGVFIVNFEHDACNFIDKRLLAQVFSHEFCEIFKNTFLKNTSGGRFWVETLYFVMFKLFLHKNSWLF